MLQNLVFVRMMLVSERENQKPCVSCGSRAIWEHQMMRVREASGLYVPEGFYRQYKACRVKFSEQAAPAQAQDMEFGLHQAARLSR